MNELVLGIWDGHDAGAALLAADTVYAAVNEERLSRRKLDVGFPVRAAAECCSIAGVALSDVSAVALSTYDFSKTLTRLLPSLKEQYYYIRRRKLAPGALTPIKKLAKYRLTEIAGNPITRALTMRYLKKQCALIGLPTESVHLVDHHFCHAATAAFFSGFDSCLAVTIDGIGDALSGSVSVFRSGTLTRIADLSGRHSLGIFFEHVTNLLNMRELEDEGKVMALANYAYPIPDEKNPLMQLMSVEGLSVHSTCSSGKMYSTLKKILWHYPSEQFAAMAQRTLEVKLCQIIKNAVNHTGLHDVALAGGVFSNIKANMRIRSLSEVDRCYVFPHMGDGGLALGAAAAVNYEQKKVCAYRPDTLSLGPSYTDEQIKRSIDEAGFHSEYAENIEEKTAHLIADGNIVFWFQGRMEYGPRALGSRSILALPNSPDIKDILNLRLKMRVWYQPFCPSMLEEDAADLLEGFEGCANRFMTMAYMVRPERKKDLAGVINIDGSCRPHIVTPEDGPFHTLLGKIKERTGLGVVLNTSFNIHGDPMVCSPRDALETLKNTQNEYLSIGHYLVKNKQTSDRNT